MDDYRPSWLAAKWGCTPEYLHHLCKEFHLMRLRVNPTNRIRPRWRFPQPTVDKLAELLNRPTFKGGEAANQTANSEQTELDTSARSVS